jgi:hypothetical protein
MIVRDGRRVEHDLGPMPSRFPISMMKMIGATGTTGSGRWTDGQLTIVMDRGPRQPRGPRVVRQAQCEACDAIFDTTYEGQIKYCSGNCRWRIAKRQSRARARASGDRGQGDALI